MKQKTGYTKVQLSDIAYESFSDMSYFKEWIPEDCEVTQVTFVHEFAYLNDESDVAYIGIDWKELK